MFHNNFITERNIYDTLFPMNIINEFLKRITYIMEELGKISYLSSIFHIYQLHLINRRSDMLFRLGNVY